jgi:hypothetical protein
MVPFMSICTFFFKAQKSLVQLVKALFTYFAALQKSLWLVSNLSPRAQFTDFTSTKVQILTPRACAGRPVETALACREALTFTCFSSTKVQILTPRARAGRPVETALACCEPLSLLALLVQKYKY